MAIIIEESSMRTERDGSVIATTICAGGERWIIGAGSRRFTREQAITVIVLADRLAAGYGEDDPFVAGWRRELR